jgi:hypothetical protein
VKGKSRLEEPDAVPRVAALAGSRQCLNSVVLNRCLKESWFLFQSSETTRAFQTRCISMREAGAAGNKRIQPCTAEHVDLPVTCSLSEDASLIWNKLLFLDAK